MNYSADRFTDEEAQRKAAEAGCTVEYSDPLTLQIDIDSREAGVLFEKQLTILREHLPGLIGSGQVRFSKSGNAHATLSLTRPYSLLERIMLQACLGSDIKRELLSYIGYLYGQANPILLFRPIETTKEPHDVQQDL